MDAGRLRVREVPLGTLIVLDAGEEGVEEVEEERVTGEPLVRLRVREPREGEVGGVASEPTEPELRLFVCFFVLSVLGGERGWKEELGEGEDVDNPRREGEGRGLFALGLLGV